MHLWDGKDPSGRGACIAVNHKFIVLSGKVRGTGAYNWWIHCLVSQFWWPQEKKLQITLSDARSCNIYTLLTHQFKGQRILTPCQSRSTFLPGEKAHPTHCLWKFQGHTRDNLRCRFPTRNMYVLLRFMVGYIIVLYIYIIYIYTYTTYIYNIYISYIYIYIHAIFLRI